MKSIVEMLCIKKHIVLIASANERKSIIEKHLTEDMVVIPEFNDGFIRRMVTSIRVTQDNNLQICIKGGYEIMASFPCDKNAA